MTTHDLIERYIDSVRNRLPYRLRRDVPLELESLIADSLEARQPVDNEEEAIVEILREMGSPDELAAQYQTQTHLIGPELFPLYKMIVLIVLSVLTAVLVALNAIDIFSDGVSMALLERIPRQVFSFIFEEAAQVVGIITIVFWGLQRFQVGFDSDKAADWDPRKLPKVVNPERFKRGEIIGETVFATVVIVVLNFFAWQETFYTFGDGTPIGFTDGFRSILMFINGILVFEIGLHLWVLRKQAWSMLTRAGQLLISIADLVVAYFLLNTEPLLTIGGLDLLFRGIIWVIALILIIDGLVKGWRFVRAYLINRQASAPQMMAS